MPNPTHPVGEIPADIREAAGRIAIEIDNNATWGSEAWGLYHYVAAQIIEQAISAERNRCAEIADEHAKAKWGGDADGTTVLRTTAKSIAASIRAPSP